MSTPPRDLETESQKLRGYYNQYNSGATYSVVKARDLLLCTNPDGQTCVSYNPNKVRLEEIAYLLDTKTPREFPSETNSLIPLGNTGAFFTKLDREHYWNENELQTRNLQAIYEAAGQPSNATEGIRVLSNFQKNMQETDTVALDWPFPEDPNERASRDTLAAILGVSKNSLTLGDHPSGNPSLCRIHLNMPMRDFGKKIEEELTNNPTAAEIAVANNQAPELSKQLYVNFGSIKKMPRQL